MKALIFPVLLFTAFACGNAKHSKTDSGSAPKPENRMEGVVHLTEECGVGVNVTQGDVLRTYSPVFLDERYRVEGMRLRFTVTPASGKPPKDCPNYIVAEFTDVTPLRS